MVTRLAITIAVAAGGAAADPVNPAEAIQVAIYYRFDSAGCVDKMLFATAQSTASRILAQAGVHLMWRAGREAGEETGVKSIGMAFLAAAPANLRASLQADALAAARPYDGITGILVFADRVTSYLHGLRPMDRISVFGHILAHEIVHVLEGVARHSESGLMVGHWTWREVRDMISGKLALSAEDCDLVRSGLARSAAVLRAVTASGTHQQSLRLGLLDRICHTPGQAMLHDKSLEAPVGRVR